MPSVARPVVRHVASMLPWLLVLVAALLSLVPQGLAAPGDRLTDLAVYLGAGAVALDGGDVYAFRTALGAPFTYPPFAALLAVPLGLLPVGFVQVAWSAATVAAVVALARRLPPLTARLGLPLTVALLLLSSPMRSHLRFGQVGIFLVLLVLMDQNSRSRRGLITGLAAAVKLTPAVFLPWLLLTDRRAFGRALLAGMACTLLGLLVLWPSGVTYVTDAFWQSARFGPTTWAGNQSMRGMLLRSDLPETAALLVWLALVALVLSVAVRGAVRLERLGDRFAAVATLAAASVAVSPVSWVHHLIWLALPLTVLVARGWQRLAVVWYVLLVASVPSLGSAGLVSDNGPDWLWHLVINVQGLTAVVAALALPLLIERGGSQDGVTPVSAVGLDAP